MVVCKIINSRRALYGPMLVLDRSEVQQINDTPGWILIYGRRKVGKTFLIRNFLEYDIFITVKRDGQSYCEGLVTGRYNSFEDLIDTIKGHIIDGRTVVVDEFQRLPEGFLDELAIFHPSGKVILSGSSLHVVERVLGSGTPLLGLVSVHRLDLVRPVDMLVSLADMRPEVAVPYAAYLREPWLVPMLKRAGNIEVALHEVIPNARFAVSALVGEVFTESDRRLSQTYEAIIRGLGAGLWRPGDLAHRLQNAGLIGHEGSNYLHSYLTNLERMGLVETVPIYRKAKMKVYRLKSQFLETYYYLADRHQTDEIDRSLMEIKHNLRRMVSQSVERFVGQLFQQLEGGQLEYSFDPELDLIITTGRKRTPVVVGEVKWGRYDRRDVKVFADKVEDLTCRKVLITKKVTSKGKVDEVEVLDASALIGLATSRGKRRGK